MSIDVSQSISTPSEEVTCLPSIAMYYNNFKNSPYNKASIEIFAEACSCLLFFADACCLNSLPIIKMLPAFSD